MNLNKDSASAVQCRAVGDLIHPIHQNSPPPKKQEPAQPYNLMVGTLYRSSAHRFSRENWANGI